MATSTLACAELSAPVRKVQSGSFCHEGFGSSVLEQPPPLSGQTSFVPAALVAAVGGELRAADGDNAVEGRRSTRP